MAVFLPDYKPLVESYLRQTPGRLSAFSFANILVWQDFFRFDFEEVRGALCVFASDEAGTFLYWPPLGPGISPETIRYCFEKMKTINKGRGITRIENVSEEHLAFFPGDQFKIYRKAYEYLYYRRNLVNLKGGDYKSRRHDFNLFVKKYAPVYRVYQPSMRQACGELFERWEKEKRRNPVSEMESMMLEDSRRIHRRVLEHFAELGLVGRVVESEGRIAAYSFGYFVGTDTFCDFLEIADHRCGGAATYIFHQLCSDSCMSGTKFINVMDDFCAPSVNRTKMSFRPAVLLPSYNVSMV